MATKRVQPPWQCPDESNIPKLKLFNSLTRQKEVFTPQFSNKVLWYSCGPTVYDAAHMGHARSYISFDILRRVLADYFSYDVFYVMNITDIDDKIIKRARQNHLYEEYVRTNTDLSKVIDEIKSSLKSFEIRQAEIKDVDKQTMIRKSIENTKNALKSAEIHLSDQSEGVENGTGVLEKLLKGAQDILSEELDILHGKDVTDNSIFSALPAKWEEAFYKDMEELNILQPDAVTRVSEYIPEIITYVEKIVENGMAYCSNGSVYFNTVKFNATEGHFYGKLVPEAFGDLKQLQEGEGDLSISEDRLSEKRNPSDFAVWKSSKPGEPSWESPWGKGRPGWHIECSVMASVLLGQSLDIHTGGYDLKFPHHDNELAQAEAYFDNNHWVRYFLHSGHLTISGCKMSKSLKNFISIKEALTHNTARQIRFAFLLHSWKDTLDYSSKTLDMALHYEKLVTEFFLNAKDSIRTIPNSGRGSFQKWESEEQILSTKFQEKQAGVHEALCDNIDTRNALENIRDLITASNVYTQKRKSEGVPCNRVLLMKIMSYISKILQIFGVMNDSNFGFSQNNSSVTNVENLVMPYLDVLATFRDNVRQSAIKIKATSILTMCDELRDITLPELGVRLEDQEGLSAIKLVDPEELAREKILKQKKEEAKKFEKEKAKKQMEEIQAAKDALRRIPPSEIFRSQTDKYSQFDEKGIPTHDADGKELSKQQRKKVSKQHQDQEKKYKDFMEKRRTRDQNVDMQNNVQIGEK